MIPSEPPRNPQLGFLYVPPYRIQGLSVAGEQTVIQVPELDVCFDIGLCPRPALSSNYVALSHAHMDHAAALTYYFSQRHFQGMGTGTVVCHPALEASIHGLMEAWVPLEAQRTPYKVIPLADGQQVEIKNNIYLRGFETRHTVPSLGFVLMEMRSKLRPEFVGMPQEQLVELKNRGTEITQLLEIPLICYTGDTAWGPHFDRPDVLGAKVLIAECTFTEPGHRSRANVGKHLHLEHIVELLEKSSAEAVVLVHLSRRTQMGGVRKEIDAAIPPQHRERVLVLMEGRANKQRYERQLAEAQADARAKGR
jgi:ribonuclease Z